MKFKQRAHALPNKYQPAEHINSLRTSTNSNPSQPLSKLQRNIGNAATRRLFTQTPTIARDFIDEVDVEEVQESINNYSENVDVLEQEEAEDRPDEQPLNKDQFGMVSPNETEHPVNYGGEAEEPLLNMTNPDHQESDVPLNAINPDEPAGKTRLLLEMLPGLSVMELSVIYATLMYGKPNASTGHLTILVHGTTFSISPKDLAQVQAVTTSAFASRAMEMFFDERQPKAESMKNAVDEVSRRSVRMELVAIDNKWLTVLMPLTEKRQRRWEYIGPRLREKEAIQDAVLAALQLRTMTSAETALGESDKHWKKWTKNDKDFNWCGAFAFSMMSDGGIDTGFRDEFFHVDNIEKFFLYQTTNRQRILDEATNMELGTRDYHAARDSMRKWITDTEIRTKKPADLDIRPGDILLLDVATEHGAHRPDHVVLVESYDPKTGHIITIGGNDGGYIADPTKKDAPKPDDPLPSGVKSDFRERQLATGRHLKQSDTGHTNVAVGFQDLSNQPDSRDLERRYAAYVAQYTPIMNQKNAAEPNPKNKAKDLKEAAKKGWIPPFNRGNVGTRVYGIGRPSIVDYEQHKYPKK